MLDALAAQGPKKPVQQRGSVLIAGVAQLVEHNLAKVGVAGSNPVARSINNKRLGIRIKGFEYVTDPFALIPKSFQDGDVPKW